MDERIMTRGFPWGEPAHPGIVKQFEDLINIYKVIRGQYQSAIDQAFDRISREIGFVVTTTLPCTLETAADQKSIRWTVAQPLQGSLFEKGILEAMGRPSPDAWKPISAGTYDLYLVWFDALSLKLRKDWLEPVHYLRADVVQQIAQVAQVRPEVQEPAHWFHPAVTIPPNEQIVISAIDTVYPELQLAQRVAMTRQVLRQVRPEVQEPAHLRPAAASDLALREIAQMFKRVPPAIPEPAHFNLAQRDILAEIQLVLRKYGM